MRACELFENYHFMSRDRRGNTISANLLLDDTQAPKILIKFPTEHRYGREQIGVFPHNGETDNVGKSSYAILYVDVVLISETYEGEMASVLKALIAKWPAYGAFDVEGFGLPLVDYVHTVGKRERPQDEKNWYHGTTSAHLESIMRTGLSPQDVENRQYRGLGGSKEGMTYLTRSYETAQMHAENCAKNFGGAPTVLKIDISGLENQIRTDHDVRYTKLGSNRETLDTRRIHKNPGQASYITIGTIAFQGRIPPTRISVAWQGKEYKRKPVATVKNDQLTFLNMLGKAAAKLSNGEKDRFFEIIGARPSGFNGRTKTYPPDYYTGVEKLVNTVHHGKSTPARYAQWISGMYRRSTYWRPSKKTNYVPDSRLGIGKLIANEFARVNAA